ncbi:MAG: hypothetical protein NZL98_02050, partial [Anaerolineales bacterium]|nr:hypothetical protein [Anaerolineales bacterium]
MIRPILPLSHPLQARVRVPPSKSLTNRALVLAALCEGSTRLQNALFSDDTRYMTEALRTLGFTLEVDEVAGTIT